MSEQETVNQPQLDIQQIYLKDVSLESPVSPEIFQKEGRPEVFLDLDIKYKILDNAYYEIVLSITAQARQEEKTVFLVEVHQAGLFHIKGFDSNTLEHLIYVYAPSVLFPYAREVISSLISKANFPQLILSPVNFEALYLQRKQQKQDKTDLM